MRRLLAAAALALALAAPAEASRFAVGVAPGASVERVAERIEAATGRKPRALEGLRSLVVEAPSARPLEAIAGVEFVERLRPRRVAFVPNDPLAPRQWHLTTVRAFDAWPEAPPAGLAPVRVAVIDSGIDLGHPEFANRIAAARSFVGGSAQDRQGHGTFVAGLIGATLDNADGIAGMAFPAQLVVAKVVDERGEIEPEREAQAIRWAVDAGARVVNLSLGGVRDPSDPGRDSFSPLEQRAIEYAHGRGAVVVAAVGNGDQAPSAPWPYASYPAALPHVIGVSALTRSGDIPPFSNRDAVYNDIAAPGEEIVSTLPRSLTGQRPSCAEQGYSLCGPAEYQHAEGTSFAAPQVSAAAALLLAVRPDLGPDQVAAVLEHSAQDVNASTGCRRCRLLRDSLSGWGRLDVTAAVQALAGPLPRRDRFESNDDAGTRAATLYGRSLRFVATIDFWDDQVDVYRIYLRKRQYVSLDLRGPAGTDTNLLLWKPGTTSVEGLGSDLQLRATQSVRGGPNERLLYRARATGWHFVEVKLSTPGFGPYRLSISKSR